ncbi:MAG: malate dehydrogenase [Methanonatronarchaeales archaeon]|nr:malate dehydrogenase [Methanonatronarchaeales archaeon]
MRKAAVVGAAGTVGAAAGYEIALTGVVDELVYIDIMEEAAQGQALDTMHAIAYDSDADVYQGDYEDAEGADVFVVTAGRPRRPGMTRMDLAGANAPIVSTVFGSIEEVSPDAVSITTTNPVDVLNRYGLEAGDRDRGRVIGFAGRLDSARFRYVLSRRFDVPVTSVEASVLGEHGEAQVPVFSTVSVGGETPEFTADERREITESLRQSSMRVIERKDATEFAPARGLTHVVEAVMNDTGEVLPCSVVLDGEYGIEGPCLGVPCVLGEGGVKEVVELDLADHELEALREAAGGLDSAYREL